MKTLLLALLAGLYAILAEPVHADWFNAPFQGVSAMTVGTTYSPQRGLAVVATVAGNVNIGLADGSSVTVPVGIGLTVLPWAVAIINSSGTTAVATYYRLK